MQKQPAVEIKQVTKVIRGRKIIDGINFSIYPGEVFGFLGPNGAGKTTTIRMIVGLMGMTNGDILIKGNSIKTSHGAAMKHIGAIVENPEMYKYLTGYQNLMHFGRMSDGVDRKRIDEVIELVGLQKRIHDKVKTYSLGMRQRLGIAQALLHRPAVLILDEPTNGLDPAGIREMREYIRNLAEAEGLAVIVSSHLLSEMELMCDRIGVLQHGKMLGVQQVHEMSDEQTQMVRFQVEPVEQAAIVLGDMGSKKPQIKDKQVIMELTRDEIPAAAAKLTKEAISIYGIQAETKTLEETFLELTGGKEIV
ncbi:ABC transporter ATP-binding protein [Terribacillus halophilus]|uniref:ABC transporter ATP-binding protein n=1 Tax=Terribacillus halophilus TaxID=361279 RepID=UPI0039821419